MLFLRKKEFNCLAIAALTLLALLFAPGEASSAERAGVLGYVSGDVTIKSPGKEHLRADVGAVVYVGDNVSTGADAKTQIVLDDGNYISLAPLTVVRVDLYVSESYAGSLRKNIRIKMVSGTARMLMLSDHPRTSKFTIDTEHAVLSSTGVDVIIVAELSLTLACAQRGKVTVRSHLKYFVEEVKLEKKKCVEVNEGKAPGERFRMRRKDLKELIDTVDYDYGA